MSSSRRVSTLLCGVLLISALVLSACGETGSRVVAGGPRAWVGGPPDGSEVPIGEVSVMCHAFARGGVSQIELYVNGSFANRAPNPDPTKEYFTASLTFETTGPGSYVVHCRTHDQAGAMVQSAPVTLIVPGEEPTPTEETEIPTATPTPTEVPPTATVPPPTGTPVPPTATSIPPTSTPIPPTATPQPPVISYFRANGVAPSITVKAGTKVTLSWEWQHVSAGHLDPGNIPLACPAMPCTRDETPTQTTTYTLRALGPGGQTTAQVTVVVTPGDTTGPSIQRVAHSPALFYYHNSYPCTPNQVTISAHVTDPSGVTAVKAVYRVVETGHPAGQWQSKSMLPFQTGSSSYSTTLGGSDLVLSRNPPVSQCYLCPATVEYYVQASDGLNNRADSSPTRTANFQYCETIR